MSIFPVSAIPSASREILVIDNSLRFNDDDSAYLSRTPSTAATDGKKWSLSFWVKLSDVTQSTASYHSMFYAGIANTDGCRIGFRRYVGYDNHDLMIQQDEGSSGDAMRVVTSGLFRDPSAWYHVVIVFDSAQGTASNRVKIYINGTESSYSVTTYPNLNLESSWNSNGHAHNVGGGRLGSSEHLHGYLAEVNFIDGQALTPSSFGQSGDYGEWNPVEYTGTYGTNGFHLDFKTSGTLGNDANGSNNWTTNNISASDQMIDTPTNNFPTLNFLDKSGVTLSEGNLKQVHGAAYGGVRASIPFPSTGKWYVEYVENSTAGSNVIGTFSPKGGSYNIGSNGGNQFIYWGINGSNWSFGASGWHSSLPIGSGSILQMAYDSDTGKTWIGVNNVWRRGSAGSVLSDGNPSAGTNPTGTWADYAEETFCTIFSYNLNGVMNFGQDSSFAGNKTAQGNQDGNAIGDFYYTPPTGFLALCTANLPAPTVIPSEHFNTVTYSGDGSQTRSITGVGFQPDFVWQKSRSVNQEHMLYDAVRGAATSSVGKMLNSNNTSAEGTDGSGNSDTQYGYLSSFDADGYTWNDGTVATTGGWVNYSGRTYVSWNWKAGGTAVSNTDGTLTSSVSANTAAGFSVVNWVGNATAGATAGHGLSEAPEMVIYKYRGGVTDWSVYTEPLGATKGLVLNTTAAAVTSSSFYNNTAPSSTVLTLGTNASTNNPDMIAYCFHSVDGYSKVGSYTGNGSADGTFVYTGFRPAYVMIKRTDGVTHWQIHDTARDTDNVMGYQLHANSTDSDASASAYYIDSLSNGFKLRMTHAGQNASGGSYIYIAFAEQPFKHSNAR
jgi:hypothetical protein